MVKKGGAFKKKKGEKHKSMSLNGDQAHVAEIDVVDGYMHLSSTVPREKTRSLTGKLQDYRSVEEARQEEARTRRF